jgi:hypothetical protein
MMMVTMIFTFLIELSLKRKEVRLVSAETIDGGRLREAATSKGDESFTNC